MDSSYNKLKQHLLRRVPNLVYFTTEVVGHVTSSVRIDWEFTITPLWPGDKYELCIVEKRYRWAQAGHDTDGKTYNHNARWRHSDKKNKDYPIIKCYSSIEEAKEATISFITWHENNSSVRTKIMIAAKKVLGISLSKEYETGYHSSGRYS